ncbi:MAG: fumarylacetoacetate hydrolase family protein, partial [Planctomycetes bacterium]|nr:fumarylacetoacetate hydrolase family protein [Planctomycetota bacterium]
VKLAAGDLIFTGTPAGVGPLEPGDKVSAGVAGVGEIAFAIGQPDDDHP